VFATRIDRIQPSATLQMTAKAAELRDKGVSVMNLSVGEPDFPTPENIQNAAIFAIKNGYTKYTPGSGLLKLREAVCEKLLRDNNLHYKPTIFRKPPLVILKDLNQEYIWYIHFLSQKLQHFEYFLE
jgi:aspartate aminotransferase